MFRASRLRTCLLICCLASSAHSRSAPAAAPIAGWGTTVDPSGDCTIAAAGGALTIEVPAGLHDLWRGQKSEVHRFNAPRVMQTVDGDFIVRVKVTTESRPGKSLADIPALQQLTGIPGTHPYQGLGLLIWDSDLHFFRCERGLMIHPSGTTLTIPWYVRDGKRVNEMKITEEALFLGSSTWLKLERSGQMITTSLSHDGRAWREINRIATDLPSRVQVGVAAVNISNSPLVAVFEEYKLLKE